MADVSRKSGGDSGASTSSDDDNQLALVRAKVLDSVRNARENAVQAANNMWSRTRIVRSKFPAPAKKPAMGMGMARRKQSTFPGSGGGKKRGSAVQETLFGGTLGDEEPVLIYDSMREMWEDDVFNLPVCKDLPRLVRRVCVVDQDDEILYMAPGSEEPDSTQLNFNRPKKTKGGSGAELSPVDEADADAYADADADEDSSVKSSETASTGGTGKKKKKAASKRSSKLARWSVRRKNDGSATLDPAQDLSSNASIIQLIVNFVTVLATHMEPDAGRRAEIGKGLAALQASVTDSSDMQLVVRDLIKMLGVDSTVTKVLKTIHQNVVLQSTVELKQKLTMKYQTKDVRSAKGWRINITLARGYAQVRHTRREQSLDAHGDTSNHWEFEWELRMTFDRRMQGMTAAQLRVTRLILGETMDEDLAEELKNTLVDGLIVM